MLHITNGDCSADLLHEAEIAGEIQPWREALMCGPTPAGYSPGEWLVLRAQYLSQESGEKLDDCENTLAEQEDALATSLAHDEVVLWFDQDLFCQVNLLYLLNWFNGKNLGRTKLSLVCIDSFPGMIGFKGLGQLSPQQLASLLDRRERVKAGALQLAHRAWSAYSASSPEALATLVNQDFSHLRFLKTALLSHLERFPSVRNGLGKIENTALDIMAGGINEFHPLFWIFSELEPAYGLGHLQLLNAIRKMISAKKPLIRFSGRRKPREISIDELLTSSFELTESGERIWQGEKDFVEINGIDEWLGGVHLREAESLWRWNEPRRTLVPHKSN
jgi:hypothetical protein